LSAATPAVGAEPLNLINTLRTAGCGGRPGVAVAVQTDPALDNVARELSRRGRLSEVITRLNYPAAHSTSLLITGSGDDATILKLLGERYCTDINDARFAKIGVFQSGDRTWIVLAEPLATPAVADAAAIARRVLELVNAARSQDRKCGRRDYPAVAPLTLSPALTEAALRHARDMAQRRTLEHRGADGSASAERVTRAGYRWQAAGENIAAGQADADTVVASWLASPGHCVNIMAPHFTEMGVAFALAPSSNPSIYWAQVLAKPLP
jgi:uncharacterized protein YkwD